MRSPSVWVDGAVALGLGAATAALVFWLGWGVLFAGDDFGSPGPRMARAARRAAWISGGVMVVAGSGLLELRLWVAAAVHLLLAGSATVLFTGIAVEHR
ncbi:hypothetical protein AB0M10_28835 [Streptomyces sp. NPDC051840]|uniref:hypothetical protein n=1 Tax=unclassified Streptomyces TaxID=2593676 RepID=UPI0034199B1B